MSGETLLALAERCEKASGPDRELDGRIWCALNGHRFVRFVRHDERIPWSEIDGSNSRSIVSAGMVFEHSSGGDRQNGRFQQFTTSPAYTASLDAAMTLVPQRWKLRQANYSAPCADDRKWHLNLHGGTVGQDTFVGRGSSQCIALCAAALRTRAHQETSNDG